MNRDLDVEISLALGWADLMVSTDDGHTLTSLTQWRAAHPSEAPIYVLGRSPDMPNWPHSSVPHYDEDIGWMEDEIERRGRQYEYVEALIALVGVPDLHLDQWPRFEDIYKLMRATPEQRARAFLKAIT